LLDAIPPAKLKSAKSQGVPDLLLHDISIETDASKLELSFDDLTLSEAMRPLVKVLAKRCKPMAPP
jgi:hypothetical protein